MGSAVIFPFGFETLLIGLFIKKISFWIKKAPLWSGQRRSSMDIMIPGHLMAFRADAMDGAAGIFPPKIPDAPYHNGSWSPTGEGDRHTKNLLERRDDFVQGAI